MSSVMRQKGGVYMYIYLLFTLKGRQKAKKTSFIFYIKEMFCLSLRTANYESKFVPFISVDFLAFFILCNFFSIFRFLVKWYSWWVTVVIDTMIITSLVPICKSVLFFNMEGIFCWLIFAVLFLSLDIENQFLRC